MPTAHSRERSHFEQLTLAIKPLEIREVLIPVRSEVKQNAKLQRWIVFFTLVGLTIQYALIQTVGEPYPALIMPGFAGDGGYRNGYVQCERMIVSFVHLDGNATRFTQRELLSELDDSVHNHISTSFLSPFSGGEERRNGWLQRVRRRLIPNLHAGVRKRLEPARLESLQGWLRGRADALIPGKSLDRVEFLWFSEKLSFQDGRRESALEPIGVFVVPLRMEK